MLLAEVKCRRKPHPAWSVVLAAASRTVRFWKILISGIKTNTDISTILNTIGVELKWDLTPTENDLGNAKSALKLAYKN
jgi:hypothetical protein